VKKETKTLEVLKTYQVYFTEHPITSCELRTGLVNSGNLSSSGNLHISDVASEITTRGRWLLIKTRLVTHEKAIGQIDDDINQNASANRM